MKTSPGRLRKAAWRKADGFLLIVAVLCATTISDSAFARPLRAIMASGVLNVSVQPAHPPFSFVDHEDFLGIDAAIARALAKRLDLKIRFLAQNGAEGAGQGADIVMNAVSPPARENALRPDQPAPNIIPYYTDTLALLAAATRPGGQDQSPPNGQSGTTIGVVEYTPAHARLNSVSARPAPSSLRIAPYKGFAALLDAFRSGEVSVLCLPFSQAAIAARSAGRKVQLQNPSTLGLPTEHWQVGIGVGDAALAEKIAQALAALKESGTLAKIFADHGVSAPANAPPK